MAARNVEAGTRPLEGIEDGWAGRGRAPRVRTCFPFEFAAFADGLEQGEDGADFEGAADLVHGHGVQIDEQVLEVRQVGCQLGFEGRGNVDEIGEVAGEAPVALAVIEYQREDQRKPCGVGVFGFAEPVVPEMNLLAEQLPWGEGIEEAFVLEEKVDEGEPVFEPDFEEEVGVMGAEFAIDVTGADEFEGFPAGGGDEARREIVLEEGARVFEAGKLLDVEGIVRGSADFVLARFWHGERSNRGGRRVSMQRAE
jgi:hypothetical protein